MKSLKNSIYTLLDIFTFNKGFACIVNGYKVYFPAKWFRYFESNYEESNVSFLKEHCKPGMVIVDIGAHLGLMSVISAQLVGKSGKVYSFEPTPKTFEVLKKVITMNHAEQIIQPVNKAVAKENKTVDFFLSADEGSNSNSLVSKNHRSRIPVKINVTSLDLFVDKHKINNIDVIKIDAEGSEYDVLLGANKSITQFKPKIILAIHPPLIRNNNHNIADIYDFLVAHNYNIVLDNKTLSKEAFCSIEDFFDVHLITK